MQTFKTIEPEITDHIATVWLNRPQVQNALNIEMLKELTSCFTKLEKLENIRVIILRGMGKSFCSGADIAWMKESGQNNYSENLKESLLIAKCFYTIYNVSKPVIALVHGAIIGGGNGLVCACDIVIADTKSTFAFSELRLGIAPSTIMPYILTRLSQNMARLLFYTGRPINSTDALQAGLVDYIYPGEEIIECLHEITDDILMASPGALAECKQLLRTVSGHKIDSKIQKLTAKSIARLKMSDEGQEGMAAFLEKRQPGWFLKEQKN